MIETSGNEIGRRIDGKLWLARTSATDSSSRTGARPPKPDTLQYPLYGAVDIALDSISAHASGQSGPTSIDPIFPGVLAILWDQGGDGPKQPFLLIGTNDNRRDGNIDVDGEGIALNTLERTDSGFAGVWGPFGLRKTGAGYFCAHAVRE